jgi:hypothetical protein
LACLRRSAEFSKDSMEWLGQTTTALAPYTVLLKSATHNILRRRLVSQTLNMLPHVRTLQSLATVQLSRSRP